VCGSFVFGSKEHARFLRGGESYLPSRNREFRVRLRVLGKEFHSGSSKGFRPARNNHPRGGILPGLIDVRPGRRARSASATAEAELGERCVCFVLVF
jgi:hypothetical protein